MPTWHGWETSWVVDEESLDPSEAMDLLTEIRTRQVEVKANIKLLPR